MAIEGILLDIDGTLLLSNEAHARSWHDTFAEFGHQIETGRIKELIGMGGDKMLPTLVPGLDAESDLGKRMAHRRSEIFRERYAPHLQAAPGARHLLQRLRDDGVRRIVATSAHGSELELLLNAAGVADLVDDAATSTDVAQSKPDPDIVQAALKKAGLAPARALMLGDTPYDVEAASKAGVRTIAMRCGGWDDAKLAGALAIYDHPADLLAHYDTSPLVS